MRASITRLPPGSLCTSPHSPSAASHAAFRLRISWDRPPLAAAATAARDASTKAANAVAGVARGGGGGGGDASAGGSAGGGPASAIG